MRDLLQSLRLRDVLDIAIVAYVFYRVFVAFRGTLAVQMLAGLGLLIVARFVAREADLLSVSYVLDNFWAFWVLALIVLFQPELRRALAQAGRSRLLQRVFGAGSEQRHHVVGEVVRAAASLASKRTGALIVVERTGGLAHYADLGVRVDAVLSAELLGTLFLPASPLHDGAVLIQGGRLTVAGCFLPLSRNLQLARTLGTRHRAALGLAEETDAVVVVVSEETGQIAIAVDARIERGLDQATLARRLGELLEVSEANTGGGALLDDTRPLGVREKA